MTKSTQQLANEMVRKCANKTHELIRFNVAQGTIATIFARELDEIIQEQLPLLELLEVARAAKISACRHTSDVDGIICPLCIALTNLQKKVEL